MNAHELFNMNADELFNLSVENMEKLFKEQSIDLDELMKAQKDALCASLYAEKYPAKQIAKLFDCSDNNVWRRIRDHKRRQKKKYLRDRHVTQLYYSDPHLYYQPLSDKEFKKLYAIGLLPMLKELT